jgi:hypothetical protein
VVYVTVYVFAALTIEFTGTVILELVEPFDHKYVPFAGEPVAVSVALFPKQTFPSFATTEFSIGEIETVVLDVAGTIFTIEDTDADGHGVALYTTLYVPAVPVVNVGELPGFVAPLGTIQT